MTSSIYCILEIRVVGKSSWKEREVGSFQLQRNFLTSDSPTSRSFQLSFPTTRIPHPHISITNILFDLSVINTGSESGRPYHWCA